MRARRVDFADIVIQVKGLVLEALAKNRDLLSAQRLEGNSGVSPKIERCAENLEMRSLNHDEPAVYETRNLPRMRKYQRCGCVGTDQLQVLTDRMQQCV